MAWVVHGQWSVAHSTPTSASRRRILPQGSAWRRHRRLLRPSEFPFQLAPVHLDEGGAAVRAGVGHRAAAQILDQMLQFATGQRVVRLYGMTAHGFGHDMLAEPGGVDPLPR